MIDRIVYKLNSRSQLMMWRIYTDGAGIYTESWQKDGKVKRNKPTIAKAKNIGKKNATTPEEQADKQALAKLDKKLGLGGYVEDADDASMYSIVFKPMLAETVHRFGFPCYISTKLDGMRMLAEAGGTKSREGHDYFTTTHISTELAKYGLSATMFDGELYNHEYAKGFEELASLIKGDNPTEDDLVKLSEDLQYHIYDLCKHEGDNEARYNALVEVFKDIPDDSCLKLVPCYVVNNPDELQAKHDEFIDLGYEGSMIRNMRGLYAREKRSFDLVKKKDFDENEFLITGIAKGEGNRSDEAGKVILLDESGVEFRAGIKGNQELRLDMINNIRDYVGKKATIQYFGKTKYGSYRMPTYQRLAELKEIS